jgi:hypothetical protein
LGGSQNFSAHARVLKNQRLDTGATPGVELRGQTRPALPAANSRDSAICNDRGGLISAAKTVKAGVGKSVLRCHDCDSLGIESEGVLFWYGRIVGLAKLYFQLMFMMLIITKYDYLSLSTRWRISAPSI